MIFLQIAWSNVLRNRRRTFLTLFAVVFGIAMMVFTNGFNDGLSLQWANSIINESDGHVQIHHNEFYKFGVSDMERIYLEDPQSLIDVIQENPYVVDVMPRVSLAGLVGLEEKSTTFYGAMADLALIDTVLPDHGKKIVEGEALSIDDPNGVIIGKALAKTLGVGVGDELIILSSTIYGDQSSTLVFIRALLEMKDQPEAEQNLILGGLSVEMREDLFDIGDGATELIVRLDGMKHVDTVVDDLNRKFAEQGLPWVAEPWDTDEMFRMLSGMFNGIGVIIMIVFSLVVSFIISSALMMSVYERIREVGSMRALGLEKGQVYTLFYLEFFVTILVGALFGLLVGCLLVLIGNYTGVSISDGQFEGVRPVLELQNLLVSFLVPLCIAAVVALFPIRSSCRMSVVDSLNYH
ncbi:MAG: ABC transporter permease [bacterium]|nr:ABC transporter permease [bacterium]